jgi:hypothetical protein
MIYKLCCKDTSIEDIYIGSTCNFHRRKSQHKSCCNNENNRDHNQPVYQFIRQHGGFENWGMVMVQQKAVENKFEKEKLEREFIERLKPSLNCLIPTRGKKEYREATKEHWAKYFKKRYEQNKEEILKKAKEYREQNKEQVAEQRKKHYEANKEHIAEQRKKRYEANKEHIAEQRKEKITCECGSTIIRGTKARHLRSQKHQDFINQ